jgi:hypothetical protein
MYQPLSCLDTSVECVQALQTEAVQNNPIIKGIELKIQEINQRIEEAKTNNKKSIDLSLFNRVFTTANFTPDDQNLCRIDRAFLSVCHGQLCHPRSGRSVSPVGSWASDRGRVQI